MVEDPEIGELTLEDDILKDSDVYSKGKINVDLLYDAYLKIDQLRWWAKMDDSSWMHMLPAELPKDGLADQFSMSEISKGHE